MSNNFTMSHEERAYLRELAKRYLEIANERSTLYRTIC
jgi:hypothetical protein